jgi:hypothetical protein
MKRTPLSRKKPLRRVSERKRMEKAATDGPRRFYVEHARTCQCCQLANPTDCHEIAAGSSRHRSVYLPNTWLALCRECHELVQGMNLNEQVALKQAAIRRDINWALGREAV